MNKWKLISAGVVGAVTGGLLGWAITQDRADEQNKALKADVHDMAQALTEKSVRIRQLEADLAEAQREPVTVESLTEVGDGEVDSKKERELTPEEEMESEVARVNLQALIEPYVSGTEPVDDFVKSARKIQTARSAPPEVISKELYAWDPDGPGDEYEKITITYYPRQRILVDEDKDLIEAPDVDAMVGWRNLNSFGGVSGDPNVVFIRNHHLQTDFEVVQEEEEEPPLHVQWGMKHDEFETQRAAGLLVFREDNV